MMATPPGQAVWLQGRRAVWPRGGLANEAITPWRLMAHRQLSACLITDCEMSSVRNSVMPMEIVPRAERLATRSLHQFLGHRRVAVVVGVIAERSSCWANIARPVRARRVEANDGVHVGTVRHGVTPDTCFLHDIVT